MKKKIWCISDPHQKHGFLKVPENIDIALCAGDVGNYRNPSMNANEVLNFIEWYESLNIPVKIFCAGNHDTSIQAKLVRPKEICKTVTYLEHEEVVIDGIKIFASPYTPSFGTGWAFNIPRQKLDQYWKDIPEDTDVLITHGPPKSILDLTYSTDDNKPEQCGCKSLMNRIKEIGNISYSLFGHIHEESNCYNAGMLKVNGMKTTFINAAVVNLDYEICNNGFIIEI